MFCNVDILEFKMMITEKTTSLNIGTSFNLRQNDLLIENNIAMRNSFYGFYLSLMEVVI